MAWEMEGKPLPEAEKAKQMDYPEQSCQRVRFAGAILNF